MTQSLCKFPLSFLPSPALGRASRLLASLLFIGFLLWRPSASRADTLSSRANQRGAITLLNKGLLQLGVDGTMQMAAGSTDAGSFSRTSLEGNAMLRYFMKPKVGVSGRFGGFFRKVGESADKGVAVSGWANYFMRLGEGMFFSPGAGLGVVVGNRDVPLPTGMVERDRLVGVSLNAELLASMFVSRRFSLTAGPTFSFLVATAGEASSEFSGAFKIGATYNF